MLNRIVSFVAILTLFAGAPLSGQSDVLLRLRSGAPLGDRLVVDSAGGLVAISQLGAGETPASGCGYRMMWDPSHAAFRVGSPGDSGTCDAWDEANIGVFSFAGGNGSRATGDESFAFGYQVEVTGTSGAGLGAGNLVSGSVGFSAGASNNCTGFACVAIGYTTTASGQGSVAIGYRATADANYAVALGHRASTNGRIGTFVWADASTTDSLEANTNNSFQIRAAGGVRLYTNASTTTGVYLSSGGSSWNVVSDRNMKLDFGAMDGEDVLTRLRDVPVTSWRYRDEEDRSIRHVGPMAQDWHRAFALGDDVTINMSDFDGINLAAIQALERRTVKLQKNLEESRAERDALREEVATLRERLDRVEALLESDPD